MDNNISQPNDDRLTTEVIQPKDVLQPKDVNPIAHILIEQKNDIMLFGPKQSKNRIPDDTPCCIVL